MDHWLVKQFTLEGITFQNWMMVALAIILVAIMLTWLLRR